MRRSGMRFVAGVVVGLPLVIGLAPSPAPAEVSSSYAAIAASDAMRITLQAAKSPITDVPFDAGTAVAQSEIDSVGTSRALASSPFPGTTVLGGPGLVAGFTNGQVSLPAYPYAAQADHPTVPETVVDQPGAQLEARAAAGRSEALAASGIQSDGTAVGSVRSTASTERRDAEDQVVSTATSAVTGFIAGPVHIGELHSSASARSQSDGTVGKHSELRLGAFSVGDTAVELTPQGVTVAGAGSPLPGKAGVDEVLRGAGIGIAYLAPVETATSIVSAGVMITLIPPPEVTGPARITYLLGRSVARVESAGSSAVGPVVTATERPAEPSGPEIVGGADPRPAGLSGPDAGSVPSLGATNPSAFQRGGSSAAGTPAFEIGEAVAPAPTGSGEPAGTFVAEERSALVLRRDGLSIDPSGTYAGIVAAAVAAVALAAGTVFLRKPGSSREGA